MKIVHALGVGVLAFSSAVVWAEGSRPIDPQIAAM
jgi:hypothetical protein